MSGRGTSVWRGEATTVPGGKLVFGGDGSIRLIGDTGQHEIDIASSSAYLEVYVEDRWFCSVGATDSDVVIGSAGRLQVVATLARLPRPSGGGPGAHAVRFHDLGGTDRVLLTWELGFAVIEADARRVRFTVHADPDLRLRSLDASTAVFIGPGGRLDVDLTTGEVREERSQPSPLFAADNDTLRQWMQGLGR